MADDNEMVRNLSVGQLREIIRAEMARWALLGPSLPQLPTLPLSERQADEGTRPAR